MSARWWTVGAGALVAASAVYWGLRLFVPSRPVPSGAVIAVAGPVGTGDLTRLLGADAPPPAAPDAPPPDARFQLIGVVAPRARASAAEGVALIAVDGKPARAYRVGAVVEGQTILQAVAVRSAQLGPRNGATQVSLDLAPPAPPTTGAPAPALPAEALPEATPAVRESPETPLAVPGARPGTRPDARPWRQMPTPGAPGSSRQQPRWIGGPPAPS
jgi:general secretion pathway protein C